MPVMEIRKRVELKEGMELIYDPPLEALASENYAFASKYAGMKARILGFEMGMLQRALATMARLSDQEPAPGTPNSIFVEFENGDKPQHSISHVFFRMP